MPKEKKSDTEVLFPETEMYGIKIRPWTYDQFISILPEVSKVAAQLKENNIRMEDLEKIKDGEEEKILDFFARLLPLLPAVDIVSKTIEVDKEEVKKWEFDKTSSIFLMIIIKNASRIKNSFGLGLTAMKSMRKTG